MKRHVRCARTWNWLTGALLTRDYHSSEFYYLFARRVSMLFSLSKKKKKKRKINAFKSNLKSTHVLHRSNLIFHRRVLYFWKNNIIWALYLYLLQRFAKERLVRARYFFQWRTVSAMLVSTNVRMSKGVAAPWTPPTSRYPVRLNDINDRRQWLLGCPGVRNVINRQLRLYLSRLTIPLSAGFHLTSLFSFSSTFARFFTSQSMPRHLKLRAYRF